MTYLEKLKDPRWQKMRLKILERDNFTCQACGDQKTTLHIHHRYYIVKTDPWEYPNEALTTLCEECHEIEKMMYPEAISELIRACKEKLFAEDIQDLATGIHEALPIKKETMNNIAWALSDPKMLTLIRKKYKSYCKKQMEEMRNKRGKK